jgi:hypothetical protein
MPVKSEKQRRFMTAVANNKDFANKVGVPTRVGKEFMNMTKKYKAGGKLEMVEKGGKKVPFYAADGIGKMQKGGKVKKGYKSGCQVRGYGMARGGKVCKIITMKGA